MNGDLLGFDVVNLSGLAIDFPYDMGVRIFQNQEDGWTLIDNPFYYSEKPYTLPSKKEHIQLPLVVSPYICDLTTPVTIRIAIQGQFADIPNSYVGAYIDIQLNP